MRSVTPQRRKLKTFDVEKPLFSTVQILAFIFLCLPYFACAQTENLHEFIRETAYTHEAGLVTDGTFLYGTHYDGDVHGRGSIFKIKPDGSEYEVIKHFENVDDGANPIGTLVLSGTTLYGMTVFGGSNKYGVIFKVETNGEGFQKLLDFNGTNGALPYASLIVSESTLYGISMQGGAYGNGLVFKLNTDGSGFQALKNFEGANGSKPVGSLSLQGSNLYGVTMNGGTYDQGTFYKINTDGSQFQTLFHFDADVANAAYPSSNLTYFESNFYGQTSHGGSGGFNGTLYKIDMDGNNFTVIKDGGYYGTLTLVGNVLFAIDRFNIYKIDVDGNNYQQLNDFHQLNGENSSGSLLNFNNTLYAHVPGGEYNYGVLFKAKTDGTEFEKIKDFTATNTGYNTFGSLVLTNGKSYGITAQGGVYNKGVIYSVDHDGTNYHVLHDFNGADGSSPNSTLMLSGKDMYGTTLLGGSNQSGVIFKIDSTGTNFEVLANFNDEIGSFPVGPLCDDGEVIYGMLGGGGNDNKGVIYQLNKSSHAITPVLDFSNTDVQNPTGYLLLNDSKLYGMSLGGLGDGVVFSVNKDGSSFKKIVDKTSVEGGRYGNSFTISGSTIYGTTRQGGDYDYGTIFSVNIDGSSFKKLFDFNFEYGVVPIGDIIANDGILYGMVEIGGPANSGGTYRINTDGTNYEVLFGGATANSNGRVAEDDEPGTMKGSLTLFDHFLYGVMSSQSGGVLKESIFRYKLPTAVTSIESEVDKSYPLYPNPAENYIKINGRSNAAKVQLFDSKGTQMSLIFEDSNTINLEHLPSGLYLLKTEQQSVKFTKK
jgi:uncharacterized repeat protein (TIGR03803 family)